MKRFIPILLSILLLAACAPAPAAQEPAAPPAAEPTAQEPAAEPTAQEPAAEPTAEPVADPTDEPGTEDGNALTSFAMTDLFDEPIDGSYISDRKLTLVNFWATWCGPCVGEIPDLSQLNEQYASQGFGVLGVLIWDDDTQGAKAFITDKGVSYPSVVCQGVFEELAASQNAIPITMFFDSQGNQVGKTVIGSQSKSAWEELILQYLGQAQ